MPTKTAKYSYFYILDHLGYKYILIIALIFSSCRVTKINKHPQQYTITCSLHSAKNPIVLKSMLSKCKYHYNKFYNGKEFSYIVYYKTETKGLTLLVTSSFRKLLLDEYYFNDEVPNAVIFEDKIIFMEDNYYDNNLFQSQGKDTTLKVFGHKENDDVYIDFDSQYNFEKAKKIEYSYSSN